MCECKLQKGGGGVHSYLGVTVVFIGDNFFILSIATNDECYYECTCNKRR